MPASIIERTFTGTADGEFTEPGIVQVTAHTAVSEIPSTSATTADQNFRAEDAKAATDAGPLTQLPATPDAATSLLTDAPTIAAPAASQAAPASITDLEARIAQMAAELAALTDLIPKLTTTTPGPSGPTRSPDTDPERDA